MPEAAKGDRRAPKPSTSQTHPDVPEEVLMPLFQRITASAMDEDYRHVAERRANSAGRQSGWRGARSGLLVAALVGGLLAMGITQTTAAADADQASRAVMVDRVTKAREGLDRAQRRIANRSALLAEEQRADDDLAERLTQTRRQATALEVRTGFGPAAGPGIEAVVNDPELASERDAVRDEDLALLVDGLWSAGAEAIAINGQRLTILSYIQNSGPAIHVNSQPLLAPYRIQAIGDPKTLQARFAESSSGGIFNDLVQVLGFEFTMRSAQELTLPGARLRDLRQVGPLNIDDVGKATPSEPEGDGQ